MTNKECDIRKLCKSYGGVFHGVETRFDELLSCWVCTAKAELQHTDFTSERTHESLTRAFTGALLNLHWNLRWVINTRSGGAEVANQ